jgi:uncharacterized protein YndB with AHSA1/START domain
MNRKQFLKSLGGVGTLAFAASAGMSAGAVPTFRARRAVTRYSAEIGAPPEAVFPLLCPVREYEWLDGWACEMIYSESGVAEENCIFRTAFGQSAVWNVDHYEPPRRIAFTVVWSEQVSRLNIALEPTSGGGTKLGWTRTFTALNEAGNAKIDSWSTERDRELTRVLDYFLKTGKMAAKS